MNHATRPESRPHRILVDLSHTADGYVGIAQDTRLVFDILVSLPGVDAAGLLIPTARHDLPRIAPGMTDEAAITAAVLHWMMRNWATREYPGPRRLHRFVELPQTLRTRHQLVKLPLPDRSGAVWRALFEKTLAPDRREAVAARDFFATDLSVMRIIDRTVWLPFLPPKRLAAEGFDFAYFCMPRPVRLPRGVRQIVRFHDAVPITDIDTVETWRTGLAHQRLVRMCNKDAVFVCNSPQSREDLAMLDPRRAESAHVIPCALAPAVADAPLIPFPAIALGRRSWRALGDSAEAPADLPPLDTTPRYVLAVSTMEPRKNYPNLIRAWQWVVNRSDPDLKLVIVGNRGWRDEAVLSAMAPHVRSGGIIHLANLPTDELLSVIRQAACFAFVSFNEGFGLPPLEAYQAGTPCLISDIPVLRWVFGDAALYVDPYDAESIAQGIERLAVLPGREELRATLLSKRESVIARFRPAALRDQWADLFDGLRGRPARETAPMSIRPAEAPTMPELVPG